MLHMVWKNTRNDRIPGSGYQFITAIEHGTTHLPECRWTMMNYFLVNTVYIYFGDVFFQISWVVLVENIPFLSIETPVFFSGLSSTGFPGKRHQAMAMVPMVARRRPNDRSSLGPGNQTHRKMKVWTPRNMDVSENRGTSKSSILIGFSIRNHPFWGTPILGNTYMG